MGQMRDLLVVKVPAGKIQPDEFEKFREYVIESIMRDVLVLDDDMDMSVQQIPIPGEVKIVTCANVEETPEDLQPVPKVGPKNEREEKQAILERLRAYRETNGIGSLKAVAKNTGRKGVTSETLRLLLTGDAKLVIADWRAVGKALDKLERGADG